MILTSRRQYPLNCYFRFARQLQSLHTAILLAEELKREADSVTFRYRSQLSEHAHRFFDDFITAQATRRKLARNDDDVRARDCFGDGAQFFTLFSNLQIRGSIAKRNMLDRINTERLDAILGEKLFQIGGGFILKKLAQLRRPNLH